MGTQHEVTTSGGISLGGTATARIERNLGMTPEADRVLSGLASRTGLSEGDVIRVALGMFKTAVEAKEEGKHFGVASSSDALDIELVGF
ncbi:hypothetical protein SAMN05444166_5506 [Singulisphaera sp. GP187]|uniref:hypothetical protein n=1 Tax=Singulisphaera sp. GP187 TaxID=1882752 RepID=UPI000928409D|nr:hypothetical protein [Singulisphaera sp. GP187]SIO57852.1 hypothetical protein SAMN05444166_5506 [Singulisphaera sp. GP187]